MSHAERPVLVGGTGRSGSTIVGHLLDHHPELTLTRPMEVRFITGNDGIADALAVAMRKPGSSKAEAASRLAVSRILERWFERAPNVGLHTSMSRDEVSDLCEVYLEQAQTDPRAAARAITYAIMARVAGALGADRWVDTTPANARKADRVEPIYPDSTVIIVNRDGRDVAASFVHQSFGPDDVFVALDQWEQRMLRIHRAVANSRPARIVQVDLVELVRTARYETVESMCSGIGVSMDAQMLDWFDQNVTADGAHGGRWRRDFDADLVAQIDDAYLAISERLVAAGVSIPPGE